jgi:hypothetical protein
MRMRRRVFLLAALLVSGAASCSKNAAPPPPPPAPASPCAVESAHALRMGTGTDVQLWNLRTSGLSRLSVRLLVATDGTVRTAAEAHYEWEAGTGSASGPVALLTQVGSPPSLAVDLRGGTPTTRTTSATLPPIGKDLRSCFTVSTAETRRLDKRSFLYAQVFAPPASEDHSLLVPEGVDSLPAASQGGRTIVVIALDWAAP